MLEELLEDSINQLENKFYLGKFHFSYSSLCKLMYSPAVFYQLYILGNKTIEPTEKHLIEGKLIHCLLLDDKSFNDQFITSPVTLPTGQSKKLVDNLFYKTRYVRELNPDLKFEDFKTEILDILIDIDYYQNIKLDDSRLAKVITEESKNYWEYLKQKEGKEIIDLQTLDYCRNSVDIIKEHDHIRKLLGIDKDTPNIEVFNEIYLEASIDEVPFGFKGILDNLVINHDERTIYINDFKTSGKALKDFKDSVEFYSYWLQCVMYIFLVSHNYIKLLTEGYTIVFNFVVIDKYFNVYPFMVSPKTKEEWFNRFSNDIIPMAMYHYKRKRYDLPYEFDTNSVIL